MQQCQNKKRCCRSFHCSLKVMLTVTFSFFFFLFYYIKYVNKSTLLNNISTFNSMPNFEKIVPSYFEIWWHFTISAHILLDFFLLFLCMPCLCKLLMHIPLFPHPSMILWLCPMYNKIASVYFINLTFLFFYLLEFFIIIKIYFFIKEFFNIR